MLRNTGIQTDLCSVYKIRLLLYGGYDIISE